MTFYKLTFLTLLFKKTLEKDYTTEINQAWSLYISELLHS